MNNLLGNILVFVPLGFLLALQFYNIKWARVFQIALFIGVLIESLQVIFKSGILDIDDVILNFFGVVLGFLSYKFIDYLRSFLHKK